MRFSSVLLCASCVALLAGCSGVKKELGLERPAPDEFAVVKRAPLAMPPDYALRPPRPGAPRPQEAPTNQQAEEAVFGADSDNAPVNASSSGADEILQQAGAGNAQPHIRQTVDAETAATPGKAQTAMQKLGLSSKPTQPPATVVNAKAEADRLKQNQQSGKPLTDGQTPSIDN